MLKAFLKEINYHPKKIICFDDLEKNIISVKSICEELKIPFEGYIYKGGSYFSSQAPLNRERAIFQLKTLKDEKICLKDEEADKRLLNK